MYQAFAEFYDSLYSSKDYFREAQFLHQLLIEAKASTVLDVGCGTGTHMCCLEELGYECAGVDLNEEMLAVAKEKVKGQVWQGDMRNFALEVQYDAVVCMFAAFNHLLTDVDAASALKAMRAHLKPGGLLVIDLYNPQDCGRKVDRAGEVSRTMEWQWDGAKMEEIMPSKVTFYAKGQEVVYDLPLRVFALETLPPLFTAAGFVDIKLWDNYELVKAKAESRNVIVTGHRV